MNAANPVAISSERRLLIVAAPVFRSSRETTRMILNQYSKPLSFIALTVALAAAGYIFRDVWLPHQATADSAQPLAPKSHAATPATKIIVGDQAQKNLGLSAKPLQSTTFWKAITVPGMIVDRPGVSDREVVAPAAGNVSQLFHVPGDIVSPGDKLFTLKLASESLQLTQSELYKTTKSIQLAQTHRDRLAEAGDAIAKARVVEVDNEISRLQVAAQAYRQELTNRGLSSADINGIADGRLLSQITLFAPQQPSDSNSTDEPSPSTSAQPLAYEMQELKVALGEQVQAGQTLCHLSNHRSLAIEGRAFRDETTLLERSVQQGWPVDVDFREEASSGWPAVEQSFLIRYIANTIDPTTRTFAFLMPLENQYKTVDHGKGTQILWRFRPGQKVLLRVRTEKLDDVFVLPADAVVFEGADAFVFTQNVNTFERKSVHVLFHDRDQVVLANDGAMPTYTKGNERWTIPAIARTAAAQLNRMAKVGSSTAPIGYHIHADGSLHKNADEGKQ
jgi:cobalt-zinc-cadmium efflux system membrane fusion protein